MESDNKLIIGYWRTVKYYIIISLGVTLMAAAINIFLDHNKIVTGGVTGLAIVINNQGKLLFGLDIPLWLTNIVLNLPLFVAGFIYLGRRFLLRTAYATVSLSLALYLTTWLPKFNGDMIISSVFGGVLSGVGLGMVFRSSATTGGTDLASGIMQRFLRHIPVARILFALDSGIIAIGLLTFGAEKAMYAVISVFICSKLVDMLLEGAHFAKAAFIITDKPDEISQRVMKELERGATNVEAQGMYTEARKNLLICVVGPKQIFKVKKIVLDVDPASFVIVADVREVVGEGFKPSD